MIVGKNQSMNTAMRHIAIREGNTASYKASDGDVWEFRINFLGAVMECRDEKISREWRPVCTIFSSFDCMDHGWSLNMRVNLMWENKVIVEDYDHDKDYKAIEEMDWQGMPWRYIMIRWLTQGDKASIEAREAALADLFETDYDDSSSVILRHCLDYLEEGGTPDKVLPLSLKEVA